MRSAYLLVGLMGLLAVNLSCDCSGVVIRCLCPPSWTCQVNDECNGGAACISGCCGGCVDCIGSGDCLNPGECCRSYVCTTDCNGNGNGDQDNKDCERTCLRDPDCKPLGDCMKCDDRGCCVSARCETDEQCPGEPCETGPDNPYCPASGVIPLVCEFHSVKNCRTCQYDKCYADRYKGQEICKDPEYVWHVSCPDGVIMCDEQLDENGVPTGSGICLCVQGCGGGGCPEGTYCCKKDSDPEKWGCPPIPQDHCPGVNCPDCSVPNPDPGGTMNENTCQWENTDCTCIELDPLPGATAGEYLSMALGKNGNPVFAGYYGLPYGDLIYGEASSANTSASITWTFVDGIPFNAPCEGSADGPREGIKEPGPNVGWYTDIAVDKDGNPHISYFNVDEEELKYTYHDAKGWHRYTLNDDGDTGRFTSIVLDTNDNPYVAYMTAKYNTTSRLRVAKRSPTNPDRWTHYLIEKETVSAADPEVEDWPQGPGLFVQLGMFSGDIPALAYYHSMDKTIKFAYWDSTESRYRVFRLNPTGADGKLLQDAGANLSMFIELKGSSYSDLVHLVFQDVNRGDLYYMRFRGRNFADREQKLIDAGGRNSSGDFTSSRSQAKGPYHYVGNYASVVVDSYGKVRVAYQDATSLDLVYATRSTSGVWSVTVLEKKQDQSRFQGAYGFFTNQVLTSSKTSSLLGHLRHWYKDDSWSSQVELIRK